MPATLSANYSVTASGTSLKYQWSRNGAAIVGATASTYITPATAFADTGSQFTVAVSNSAGVATSTAAALTVTARAPQAGDLRFQQVDAASTVNGYLDGPTGIGSDIDGRLDQSFSPSIGSPLYLSDGACSPPPVPAGIGCVWFFQQYFLPDSLASLGLSTYYGGDLYKSFQADLANNKIVAGTGNPPNAPNSVITSLDLEPLDDLFGASWIQSKQVTGFDLAQHTLSADDLQAAVAQDGLHGRVVTAISYDSDSVTYLTYGWQQDAATLYEAKTVVVPLAGIAQAATDLAAEGYILTAAGGSGFTDSFILVGTRVQGDTMPRPFVALPYTGKGETFFQQVKAGYAIVGIVQSASGNLIYLMQR